MSDAVTVEADTVKGAGHAIIRVAGKAGFAGPFDYCIRRNDDDERHFGSHGWQREDARLIPDQHSIDGNDLLLHVGPNVVQGIESQDHYKLELPHAGIRALVYWPDVPLLPAASQNMVAQPPRSANAGPPPEQLTILRPAPSAPPPTEAGPRLAPPVEEHPVAEKTEPVRPTVPPPPVAPPEPVVPQPAAPELVAPAPVIPEPTMPAPAPPGATAASRRGQHLWLLLLLIPVAAAGGYLAWRQWQAAALYEAARPAPHAPEASTSHPQTSPSPVGGTSAPAAAAAPPGPDVEHMSGIDLTRSHVAPDVLVREAERRMQLGGPQRNDALLLMQVAADRGYAPADAALGRFYDPNLPHPADIHPDEHEAALRYHAAVQGGDNSVADARAALKSYLEQRVQRGDVFAPQILKDFW